MASTKFVDYSQNTPIVASWLNDVNGATYTTAGTAKTSVQSAAAWVRFAVGGGVVTIQQSSNISTVVRVSVGVYTITYGAPLANIANCYSFSMNIAGFQFIFSETAGSVTIHTTDTTNTLADPTVVCAMVFGAN